MCPVPTIDTIRLWTVGSRNRQEDTRESRIEKGSQGNSLFFIPIYSLCAEKIVFLQPKRVLSARGIKLRIRKSDKIDV